MSPRRLQNAWLSFIERLLLRGAWVRLGVMATLVVVVAVTGGLLLVGIGEKETLREAIWWAFLRLTDPGYLGDDEGTWRRAISTGLTIAGYVLFMGALIAILTQWLYATIEKLQRGETPISMANHILILGMTDRTPQVLDELRRATPRLQRFLALRGARRTRFVCLVDHLDQDVRAELADYLGSRWTDTDIVLRSGNPLVADHLERVDFARAAAIIIPGSSKRTQHSTHDAVVIKTLLSIASHPSLQTAAFRPRLIAELADGRLDEYVQPNYDGIIELLAGDRIIARLIAQNLRHRGLSWVLGEILALDVGADMHYIAATDFAGRTFGDVALSLQNAVALGFVRPLGDDWTPHLNPDPSMVLDTDDRLVVIGYDFHRIRVHKKQQTLTREPAQLPPVGASWPESRRVLVLGWNSLIAELLRELASYPDEKFEIDLMTRISVEQRKRELERFEVDLGDVEVNHIVGDYTNARDLKRLDMTGYHNVLVLGRRDANDGETSDAQSVVGYLMVRKLVGDSEVRPSVLVELTDPDNTALFDDRAGEVMLSPVTMARLLAHVAARPELNPILDELFTHGGAELHYRPPADHGLTGTKTFREIQVHTMARGELTLGVRISSAALDVRGDLELAPRPDTTFELDSNALLLVLTTT